MKRDSELYIDDLPEPALPSIPGVMNAEALARLLGVSETTARGVGIKLPGNGRWDVAASLRAYLDRLREHAGRAGRPSASGDNEALRAEKLRLTAAQREAQELKNAQMRAELVPVAQVRQEWTALATDLRAGLMAIPARVSARAGLSREAAALLEAELREALEELTDER